MSRKEDDSAHVRYGDQPLSLVELALRQNGQLLPLTLEQITAGEADASLPRFEVPIGNVPTWYDDLFAALRGRALLRSLARPCQPRFAPTIDTSQRRLRRPDPIHRLKYPLRRQLGFSRSPCDKQNSTRYGQDDSDSEDQKLRPIFSVPCPDSCNEGPA
jgi:hypothetical protein